MTHRPAHRDRDYRRRRRHRARPLPTEVTWHEGDRNEAWDELWRRILSDVLGKANGGPPREPGSHTE